MQNAIINISITNKRLHLAITSKGMAFKEILFIYATIYASNRATHYSKLLKKKKKTKKNI